MAYWLFKSEASCFSYDDLVASPGRSTGWDGIRNYQARNMLRDQVKKGDLILFYHSNANPSGIAGIAEVTEEAHPDPTAFISSEKHYDPKSDPDNPTWFQVTVRAVQPIEPLLGLPDLRKEPRLEGLELLRKGSRLSVHPVSAEHWSVIQELAGLDSASATSATTSKPKRPTRKKTVS